MTPDVDFEIRSEKLVRFLLNPNHKEGWSKAKLLLANGFSADDPEPLAKALYDLALAFWPGQTKTSPYGVKYIIDGPMKMPSGATHAMRTVWQIDTGSNVVRFITAY